MEREKIEAALAEYEKQSRQAAETVRVLETQGELARAHANQCRGAVKAFQALLNAPEDEKPKGKPEGKLGEKVVPFQPSGKDRKWKPCEVKDG